MLAILSPVAISSAVSISQPVTARMNSAMTSLCGIGHVHEEADAAAHQGMLEAAANFMGAAPAAERAGVELRQQAFGVVLSEPWVWRAGVASVR